MLKKSLKTVLLETVLKIIKFNKLLLIILSIIMILSSTISFADQSYIVHKQSAADHRDELCTGYWLNVVQDWIPVSFNRDGTYYYGYGGDIFNSGYYELEGDYLYLNNGDEYEYRKLGDIPMNLQNVIKTVYSDFIDSDKYEYGLDSTVKFKELTDDTYIFYHDYGYVSLYDDSYNFATYIVPLCDKPGESNGINVALNGQLIDFDQPPVIVNDRTLVPLRAVFEAMGATVDWDQDTQTVVSERNGIVISLEIGSDIMYRNGEAVALDVPSQVLNNRTLVPVRAISEAFGADVDWNDDTRTVVVNLGYAA